MAPKDEKREKRTKPCCNCKRSKVKCVYTNNLPCQRCIKTGQAATCQFVTKLPSLKLPSLDPNGNSTSLPSTNPIPTQTSVPPPPPPPTTSSASSTASPATAKYFPPPVPPAHLNTPTPLPPTSINISQLAPPNNFIHHHHVPVSQPHYPVHSSPPNLPTTTDRTWKSSIEQRLSTFDSKIDSLVDLLKMNQQFAMNNQIQFMQQQQLHQQQRYGTTQIDYTLNNTRVQSPETTRQSLANSPELLEPKRLADDNYTESTRKKRKLKDAHSKEDQFSHDFRDGFLSKKEAFELFDFFNANISQQLFGFEISKFNIEDLWETCPILVCAISTIASIHHPKLSVKSGPLQGYLRNLCGSIILNRPKNEKEGFNTIVALVLCSFWLTDSQMFTGLALQLAKEYGLNRPSRKNKDKLKLWYLLYVLDGQQSLTFNRQPLLNSEEYSLKHSKELLLQGQENIVFKDRETKLLHQTEESTASLPTDEEIAKLIAKQRLTDMRLVSQVEYNQALNEAFKGNAWDLLSPSAFGMPSKSNLELDKWMVSWTVLLAPGNFGAVWSTKSTLIYYNFAKMHINSTAVRKLTIDPNNNSFPKWDSSLTISTVTNSNGTNNTVKQIKDSDEDWEDSSDDEYGDDDFLSNKELVSSDEAVISANIALNAAHTVLNLVINDKDILDNLKYVPVHIHIMLYYAALLLMNPPAKSNNQTIEINEIQYHENLLNNLKVVYLLQRKIYTNLPIDSKFGNRLIKNLHDVTLEKLREVQKFVDGLPDDKEEKLTLSKTINSLLESNDNKFEEIFDYELSSDGSSRSGTPLPEKISAWPGSNHGHP